MLLLILERERRGGRERNINVRMKHQWVASCMRPKSTLTGIPTHNLLVQPATPQPTEPHLWKDLYDCYKQKALGERN